MICAVNNRPLWSDTRTEEECCYEHPPEVIYNLFEDIGCLKEDIADLEREEEYSAALEYQRDLDHGIYEGKYSLFGI